MSHQNVDAINERIFQAAKTLLSEAGEGFTMEDLVKKSQVSRATIYRHVGSKEALLKRLQLSGEIEFEESIDVRSRILQAAKKVFGLYGFSGSTIEQVAREAGVGVATVYRHFGDKDNLVWTFIDEMSPRSTVRELLQDSRGDISEDLTKFAIAVLTSFTENREIMRLILAGNPAEKEYIRYLRRGSDRVIDRLAAYLQMQIQAGRLENSAPPQELALAFLGMIISFAITGPIHYGMKLGDVRRTSDLIVGIFLNGLKPQR